VTVKRNCPYTSVDLPARDHDLSPRGMEFTEVILSPDREVQTAVLTQEPVFPCAKGNMEEDI
jgi:hypothetical protein